MWTGTNFWQVQVKNATILPSSETTRDCAGDLFIKEKISAHLRCNVHVKDHFWVLLNQ
jgi:hypothetical protein